MSGRISNSLALLLPPSCAPFGGLARLTLSGRPMLLGPGNTLLCMLSMASRAAALSENETNANPRCEFSVGDSYIRCKNGIEPTVRGTSKGI